MRGLTFKKFRRLTAYIAGSVLILLGVMGLLFEFSEGLPSTTNFSGYVLAAVLITCGVLVCVAVRLHYGGGLWSFSGLMLVATALGRFTFVWQTHMQGRQLISPAVFYSTAAVLWGAGCYCLFWGHLRHRRESK